MPKNSKHFVYIINEEERPKMAALRHSVMALNAINLVSIFNVVKDKIRYLYQVGDSGTPHYETMLHGRYLWPDDWCNFIANHLLKKFWYHKQNWNPTIAKDIPLPAILKNRNDNGFVPKSMKNASQLSQIKQKRQRILDNRHQFPQNGWRNAIRSRTRLFIQPKMAFSTDIRVSWTRDTFCDSCSSSGKVSSVGNETGSPLLT
jgi:hypothetical protein